MSHPLLDLAYRQIVFARQYTLTLIDDLSDDEWLCVPPGASTHIAWQVGHLAMAEYGLCLFRIRGRQPEDLQLMSSTFRKRFSRGSTPVLDPQQQMAPREVRAALDRIHNQVILELPSCPESVLEQPVAEPYAVYGNKLGALLFCSHHEMIHAGQIGLLRRLLGKPPVR